MENAYVRSRVFHHLGMVHCNRTNGLREVITNWIKNGDESGYLLFFCFWVIWLSRNAWLFSGVLSLVQVMSL